MAHRWFYSHNGNTLGPVSARQLKYLAATGGLMPEDLIWPEGTDAGQGVVAAQALNFAALRRLAQEARARPAPAKPQSARDQLPGWVDEIDRVIRDPEQAKGPVPEWLREPEPASPGLPDWLSDSDDDSLAEAAEAEAAPAPVEPAEGPAPAPVGDSLLERMGIDPVTERIIDWPRFNAWLEDQRHQQAADLPLPAPNDIDPFHTARKQLVVWMDLPENRERLERGEMVAVRQDPRLGRYMRHFERYGRDKMARLWEYVDFLIEARTRKA
jgi:hypothetical protein